MIRRNKKNIRRNFAVTEIVGCILMLGIATSSFSVVYYQVVNAPTPNPPPIVELSGAIDNNQVIITHRGGEPLDLDTELVLNIGGTRKSFKVGDFLDSKSKEDGVWCLGERFIYPLEYDFDYSAYPGLDINVVDSETGSLLMTGVTKVDPVCDLSVIMTVDNLNPIEFGIVTFTITVVNEGNINASGALIQFTLGEGLTYVTSMASQGSYDHEAGIWNFGRLRKGLSSNLIVRARVGDVVHAEPTQLVLLLDGSGSIEPANWTLMLNGLSAAVEDESRFPHNGNIELTVIQFGGKNPAYAELEIGPIVVTKSNVNSILEDIKDIDQIGDKTPTSCAVYMAADVLKASGMFDPDVKQVVLLVTDGNPTHSCACDGDYIDINDITSGPKDSVIEAREYLVDCLDLSIYEDSFNAISVELAGDGHSKELVDHVVWPQPGYYAPDFIEYTPRRGFVRNVSCWEDFADSINESFELIFNGILVTVNLKSSVYRDPKSVNDVGRVMLIPKPSFVDNTNVNEAAINNSPSD